jgi:virginiamycin B lyase
MGYGENGTGSNLYRDVNGSFTQTPPANAPSGYAAGGGVYALATSANQVYWVSAYSGQGFQSYFAVECGGAGSATLCEPTVDEPTTMLVDGTGTFWVGGLSFNGGGMIATSAKTTLVMPAGVIELVLGPQNAVWGALQQFPNYSIARFSNSGGTLSISAQYSLPSGDAIGSLTYGGDGALWFTDQQRNAIGRMDANGNITEHPLPSANALGQPFFGVWQIATACDGAVWFTEPGVNKVGRIDAHGTINEFAIATPSAYPNMIAATAGPKCTAPELWVAEQTASKLASISY